MWTWILTTTDTTLKEASRLGLLMGRQAGVMDEPFV